MTVFAFDTLKISEELQASGFPPEQAKAIVRAIDKGRSIDLSDLATKADLAAVKAEIDAVKAEIASLKAEIAALGADLEAKIELLRRDMTIRLGGMLIVAVGVVLTAMRYLPPPHP